jgi:2-oxoglutarate ferredoxin oxidoreductase subunit delta
MITVNEDLCKGCNICTEFCPRKVYEQSKELNRKGVHLPIPHTEKCTNCGLCTLLCPDQALKVDDDDES